MYCPQCGKELELDSAGRFCRYCGFLLNDTKDNLRGYTDVKRGAYKYANVSYMLLLVLFWIQYFNLVPWDSVWGGKFWLVCIFGFVFGLWFMGNWVAERPAKYVKFGKGEGTLEISEGDQARILPPSTGIPIRNIPIPETDKVLVTKSEMETPPSVTEHTTRHLS